MKVVRSVLLRTKRGFSAFYLYHSRLAFPNLFIMDRNESSVDMRQRIHHFETEKRRSIEWKQSESQVKNKLTRQWSTGKVMVSFFLDIHESVLEYY